MIKTLIKHTIIDYAIEVFFDQVYDNLIKSIMTPDSIERHMQMGTFYTSAKWSFKLAQDLKQYNNIDIEVLMNQVMKDELKFQSNLVDEYQDSAHSHLTYVYSP